METKQSFRDTGIFHIDSMGYDIQKLTFSQIRIRFHTGRAFVISGIGRDRKYGYRYGCMTEIGDIEISQWTELIQYLIERDSEQSLQKDMVSWVTETYPWLHTQKEREDYALSLHASRIFDCEEWFDYVEFNKLYRPEVLMGTKKGETQNACE